MDLFQVVILALVEGVTEFLPVSSTGHLILTGRLMGLIQTEFVKSFEIAIQLGAILSVIALYGKGLVGDGEKLKRVGAAFIPTGILGVVFYGFVKSQLLGNEWVTVGALAGGGLVMIGIEKLKIENGKLRIEDLSYARAMLIGLVQAVSMIPGVSRAMATILGGVGVGLSRVEAVEMSFLLAVPTMFAATGLDLVKSGSSFTGSEWVMLGLGFGLAFVSALVSVRWLLEYVKNHDFGVFGIYRIILAGLFWWNFLR